MCCRGSAISWRITSTSGRSRMGLRDIVAPDCSQFQRSDNFRHWALLSALAVRFLKKSSPEISLRVHLGGITLRAMRRDLLLVGLLLAVLVAASTWAIVHDYR